MERNIDATKILNKRAKNIKLAWIFSTANASIIMVYHKDSKKQTRRK